MQIYVQTPTLYSSSELAAVAELRISRARSLTDNLKHQTFSPATDVCSILIPQHTCRGDSLTDEVPCRFFCKFVSFLIFLDFVW